MRQEFFKENRKRLLEIMPENSICILFSGKPVQKSADECYPFIPNRNFYYLTGLTRENLVLMLTRTNKKTNEYLWIEKGNPELARWVGEKICKEDSERISGIKLIEYIDSFESSLHRELLTLPYPDVYLDLERRSWKDQESHSQVFADHMLRKYPFLNIQNAYHIISDLRRIKTPDEVVKIRKAIEITHNGLNHVLKHCKPGMKEYELEAYFDFILRSHGVKEHAFQTIAACGINASTLHYCENNCETKRGDLILLDLGAQFEWYNSDITRTVPVTGKFTSRQKDLYQIVLDAQLKVIETIKPGLPYKNLNETCKYHLAKGCQTIGLIKEDIELQEFYFHGVSHYLGLDTHDVGRFDDLRPGMVLTVEPGLYLREENLGIRIEDNILVTDKGHENLSKEIPKTISDVEEWMARK